VPFGMRRNAMERRAVLLSVSSACSKEAESQTPTRDLDPSARSLCRRQRNHLFSEPAGARVGATGGSPRPPGIQTVEIHLFRRGRDSVQPPGRRLCSNERLVATRRCQRVVLQYSRPRRAGQRPCPLDQPTRLDGIGLGSPRATRRRRRRSMHMPPISSMQREMGHQTLLWNDRSSSRQSVADTHESELRTHPPKHPRQRERWRPPGCKPRGKRSIS
jgi:hypothetical protein